MRPRCRRGRRSFGARLDEVAAGRHGGGGGTSGRHGQTQRLQVAPNLLGELAAPLRVGRHALLVGDVQSYGRDEDRFGSRGRAIELGTELDHQSLHMPGNTVLATAAAGGVTTHARHETLAGVATKLFGAMLDLLIRLLFHGGTVIHVASIGTNVGTAQMTPHGIDEVPCGATVCLERLVKSVLTVGVGMRSWLRVSGRKFPAWFFRDCFSIPLDRRDTAYFHARKS